MNMKTEKRFTSHELEDILKQVYHNHLTVKTAQGLIEEGIDIFHENCRFKSPSPAESSERSLDVSQQLTEKNIDDAPIQYSNEEATAWVSGYNSAICQLSVSPDAQRIKDLDEYAELREAPLKKEIEELKAENEKVKNDCTHYINAHANVCKQLVELQEQLTSKESKVKRAVEALREISIHGDTDSKVLAFKTIDYLKGNKTEQPLYSICKCKEQKQVSYNECCGDSCINIKNIEQ